jgi:hypothetical protein
MHLCSPLTFAAALTAIPEDDWNRNCEADRSMMLGMTSKRVKETVSKLRRQFVVKMRETFMEDANNGTAAGR